MQRESRKHDKRGNKYDRRERKLWLLGAKESRMYGMAPFGGDGTCVPCVHCHMPLTLANLTEDRILPGSQGGRYTRDNIQPSCLPCNSSRQDKPM
jgi:5-methylcytosine-specific restriction endonuclease McrA